MQGLTQLNMAFAHLLQQRPLPFIIGLLCTVIVQYNEAVDLGK